MLEQRLRLGRLLEGEGAVDDGPEVLGPQQPRQLVPVVSGAHRRAVDRDLLREDPADVLIRLGTGGGAAGDEPAAPCQCPNAPGPGGRADVFDYDVDAALLRDAPDLLREVGRLVV